MSDWNCGDGIWNMAQCYNAEWTICDLVRDERKIGMDAVDVGLKAYADCRDKGVAKFMARVFGVERELSMRMGGYCERRGGNEFNAKPKTSNGVIVARATSKMRKLGMLQKWPDCVRNGRLERFWFRIRFAFRSH